MGTRMNKDVLKNVGLYSPEVEAAIQGDLMIVSLMAETVKNAISYTKKMGEITTRENPNVTIPILNFRGIPTGIDIRKAVDTGCFPSSTQP